MNYELHESEGCAPIKLWTRGVPVEGEALRQLENVARLPIIHKWVAANTVVHLGTLGTGIAAAMAPAASCRARRRRRCSRSKTTHWQLQVSSVARDQTRESDRCWSDRRPSQKWLTRTCRFFAMTTSFLRGTVRRYRPSSGEAKL
jgi:hypothetical protein